jgi:hypothetical protein
MNIKPKKNNIQGNFYIKLTRQFNFHRSIFNF